MKKSLTIFLLLLALSLLLCGCGQPAPASDPAPEDAQEEQQETGYVFTEPVKLLITHGVGGTVDTAARAIAPYLAKELGVNVVPENREGSGGRTVRAEVFNRTEPDGYTLLMTGMPSMQLGEVLFDGDYKTDEFTFIGNVTGTDTGLVYVAADSDIQTLDNMKALGADCTLASGGGYGSSDQLLSMLLRKVAGVEHTYIPYDGDAEAVTAVLGHQVTGGLSSLSTIRRFSDQVRVLGVYSEERVEDIDAPTFAELGYEGMISGSDIGIVAPSGLPEDVITALSEALVRANNNPEFLAWAEQSGTDLNPLNSEEYKELALFTYEQLNTYVDDLKAEIANQK